VYYHRVNVQVTDRWFVVDGLTYPIGQLNRLRTGRGPLHPLVQTTVAVAVVFVSAFAVSFPMLSHNPAAWLGVALVAVVPAALAVLGVRFQRRPYQLWADFRGETVLVFSTLDEKTYGHVCRALIRARESYPPEPSSAAGLAILPEAA
jgi:hypothetical protein